MTSSGRWARYGSRIVVLDAGGGGENAHEAELFELGYPERWPELEVTASGFPETEEEGESPSALEPGGLLGSLADRFRRLVQAGQEVLAITEASSKGQTDVNQLTNLVFFARHPELHGRRNRPEERQLAQEWLTIRDTIVRPTVAPVSVAHPARPSVGIPTAAPPKAGPVVFGLDTASVAGNKNPNWAQAKAEVPIAFAIIRSNWGVS